MSQDGKAHINALGLTGLFGKMGGTRSPLSNMARKIWGWAEEHNNWLTAADTPGALNMLADKFIRWAIQLLE